MALLKRSLLCCLAIAVSVGVAQESDWPSYGHDPGNQRFSPLAQIDRSNVRSLKIAWIFRTGDAYRPARGRSTAFEATPLFVDGALFLATPLGSVISLDPVTGKERWRFTTDVKKDAGYGDFATRGVSTWMNPSRHRQIYIATINAQLIALDAATGKPSARFGDNGRVDLRASLRIAPREYSDYEETSPPAIVGRTIIVGSAAADNGSINQPSGEVRGFDAETGKLKWTWDPIPQDPHAPGADSWQNGSAARTGAANAWSVLAADPAHNLVFVPTGSASPDHYGGERPGNNLFANSIVALKADTGAYVWHFQTVHHDLWDYDVASPPVLFDIEKDGRQVPAIAVGSKTANLFILNRETGEPIFGVEERPVPKSDVPGEVASPTQPFPLKPAPVSNQTIKPADAWGVDEADRKWCSEEFAKLRMEGMFTPPSLKGTLVLPGNVGGMAWGGAAYDNIHKLLILPENHLAAEIRLLRRNEYDGVRSSEGRRLNGDWEFASQRGTPYGMMRRFLLSPKGIPCTPPPWGTLLAVDARSGERKWETSFGQLQASRQAPQMPAEYGSISLGGPLVTAGGLVFIAGTLDPAIYGFDVENGKQLWKGSLPTSARSSPMTYQTAGKQYVIVSAGGHQPAGGSPLGDYVVAFTL